MQPLLAFHDLDRQCEINQPRLQEGQRQHIPRVDKTGAVAGMGPHVELEKRSAPRVALRPEIDFFQQVSVRMCCSASLGSQRRVMMATSHALSA